MAKPLAVDFSGVESGGGRVRVPEDDYRLRVASVKQTESKSSGNPMLVWDFEFLTGKGKGKKIRDRTVLTPDSLWKLKSLIEAMGIAVPSRKVALDLKKYIGKELGATVVDDEYEGKMYSKISDYVSLDVLEGLGDEAEDEEEDEEEEEEEPVAKKSKKGKKSKKAVNEDEDEIEELDLDEL